MRIGDYFSGIGGFSAAAERVFGPGCIAYHCEKDAFARKILNKHWPNVPCYEDITQTDPATLPRADAVVGGWPCQGNSSAGKRKGHGDARSGLFSELLRHVDGMDQKPAWIFLENVPGLVSVNSRRDFADVILQLQRRGYVGCVRRLDAQYDGLAQRRARLLFVGGLGRAGIRAVQLITEGGKRYPAPRREKGQEVAGTLGGGSGERGWSDDTDRMSFIPYELDLANRGDGGNIGWHEGDEASITLDTSGNIGVAMPLLGLPNSSHRADMETYVTHTLTGNGFDASEDGTGRGSPLVVAGTLQASGAGTARPAGMVSETDFLIARCDTASEGSRQDGESCTFVAFNEIVPTLRREPEGGGANWSGVSNGRSVRRLSPTECERLQGFSWLENGHWTDGHTCLCGLNYGRSVATEGEPCKCPDGPRYRVLGNAAPPPMLEWIFRQIAAAEGA